MIDGRRRTVIAVGLIVAIVVIAYLRPLVFGDTFVLRDHLTLDLPSRAHLATSLRAGEIPEWWDGVGLGVPFAANPLNGVAYAPTWLVALLPVGLGADVLVIVHVLLLGLGAALLSRRLGADTLGSVVAAGISMCGGYTASMVTNGLPLFALAWMPWVAWAADRVARQPSLRSGLALAALAGAQLMVGDPAAIITAGWLALLFVVARAERRRRALLVLIASFAAAAALAAVALLPALLWSGESRRGAGIALADAGVWSLHPLRMLEWVWPDALGNPAESSRNLALAVANTGGDQYMGSGWSLSLFVGAPTLMFAVAGALRPQMRARGLLIGSLVFVVLALGTFTPLYGWYRMVVLPEQLVRYPERHLGGALVVWAALAGAGFTSVFGAERYPRRWWKPAAVVVALLVVLVTVGALARGAIEHSAGTRVDGHGAWSEMMRGGVAAVIVAGAVLVAIALRDRGHKRWIAPALAAVALVGHLVTHGWSIQPLVPRSDVDGMPALLAGVSVESAVPRPRLYQHSAMLRQDPKASSSAIAASMYQAAVANTGTRFGFAYAPGYDPVGSPRLKRVWEAGAAHGARLLDLFGVELRTVRTADDELTVLHQSPVRPRAFVTSRFVWIGDGDAEALLASLFGAGFDRELIRLAGTGANAAADAPGLTPCELAVYEAERVVMRCSPTAPGYAVLLDAWAPGWTATVDGRATHIERADGVVRAVAVSAGTHDVELRYRTPGLRSAALISLLAWVALVTVALVLARRRKKGSDPVS